jgi:GNAT superfamily N-acetyltransferase
MRSGSSFDRLVATDLGDAIDLSTAEAWNQTPADWSRVLRLAPDGCFAARDGSRLVGTVTTTRYGSTLGWIGMMIVHAEFRGRGIGAALMRMALDHLSAQGIPTVKLDATPAGRPLYESLGFTAEVEVERWRGTARSVADGSPPMPDEVRSCLIDFDRHAFGADRSELLPLLFHDAIHASVDAVAGYALARSGRTATYVGPVMATDAAAGTKLLQNIIARLANTTVCVDLHRGGFLSPDVLADAGLSKQRVLTRMSLGTTTNAATTPAICASAGPELG